MIAHTVTIVWKEGTDPAAVADLGDALKEMAAGIPDIVFYRAGPNTHLRPNGADFAVIAVVKDEAGLNAYLDAPAHTSIVAERMAPHIGTRQAVQLDIGDVMFAELSA